MPEDLLTEPGLPALLAQPGEHLELRLALRDVRQGNREFLPGVVDAVDELLARRQRHPLREPHLHCLNRCIENVLVDRRMAAGPGTVPKLIADLVVRDDRSRHIPGFGIRLLQIQDRPSGDVLFRTAQGLTVVAIPERRGQRNHLRIRPISRDLCDPLPDLRPIRVCENAIEVTAGD